MFLLLGCCLVCPVSVFYVRRLCLICILIHDGVIAEAKGARYIYRTGAAFVSTRLGIYSKPPITAAELKLANPRETGGLILAGSYVPKTTAQLKFLIERRGNDLSVIEIGVEDLIASPDSAADMIARVVKQTEKNLKAGKDTLVMTSRALITGGDELSSLAIGSRVAEALVKVLQGVEVRPRYIIAKVFIYFLLSLWFYCFSFYI